LSQRKGFRCLTTGAGNPSKYMAGWKAAGIKVVPVVASVAMAKLDDTLRRLGFNREGGESGGHVGELTTMVYKSLRSATRRICLS
jgi:enoyl-[acyl-carrier protein] reductase II